MRKRGLSYGEISKKTGLSKSTLSFWLKNILLKPEQKKRLYTKQIEILSRGPQSQKERREREIEKIIKIAGEEIKKTLSEETFKMFGAALYWAEGGKTKSFEITNSDPFLIAFMIYWFENFFATPPTKLKAHLNIHSQQNEKEIKRFWSDLTKIPIENFGKTFIKPASTGFKKNNLYYGTIKVRVPKGTDMKHRVFGLIEKALQQSIPKVESIKRKWVFLEKADRKPINLNPL